MSSFQKPEAKQKPTVSFPWRHDGGIYNTPRRSIYIAPDTICNNCICTKLQQVQQVQNSTMSLNWDANRLTFAGNV